MTQHITKLLHEYLEEPCELTPSTTFRSLGMDDYEIQIFGMDVEESLGITFSIEECEAMRTVQDMVDTAENLLAIEREYAKIESV